MPLDQKAIIKRIDDILGKCDLNATGYADLSKSLSELLSAIHRLAPPGSGSPYATAVEDFKPRLTSGVIEMSSSLQSVYGILQALRNDYDSGHLQSVVELIHADIFADFLEMADYLLEQGYKDPAAVVTGSVLEEHVRKLCIKHGIPVVKADGSPKKADALNADLAAGMVYTKLDQKSVTGWLDLRNKAAHGKYNEYTDGQVSLMLQAVRDFLSRNQA
jgi:hypothetical protein